MRASQIRLGQFVDRSDQETLVGFSTIWPFPDSANSTIGSANWTCDGWPVRGGDVSTVLALSRIGADLDIEYSGELQAVG